MIIDYRTKSGSSGTARLFSVIDSATGSEVECFYADDDNSIYRMYDSDERGNFFAVHPISKSKLVKTDFDHREDGVRIEPNRYHFADGSSSASDIPLAIAQTEYYLPIRIVPRPNLSPEIRATAERILKEFREANG